MENETNIELIDQSDEQSANDSQTNIPGKFKTSEQLAKAYTELEAEFTRRSQKICQLAKENRELSEKLNNSPGQDMTADNTPMEEQGRPAVPSWGDTVRNFLDRYPNAVHLAQDIAELINDDTSLQNEQGLTVAYAMALDKKYITHERLIENQEFIQRYIMPNQTIRGQIIESYLSALPKQNPPDLMGGNGGYLPLSGRRTLRTIEEASALTEKLLK